MNNEKHAHLHWSNPTFKRPQTQSVALSTLPKPQPPPLKSTFTFPVPS